MTMAHNGVDSNPVSDSPAPHLLLVELRPALAAALRTRLEATGIEVSILPPGSWKDADWSTLSRGGTGIVLCGATLLSEEMERDAIVCIQSIRMCFRPKRIVVVAQPFSARSAVLLAEAGADDVIPVESGMDTIVGSLDPGRPSVRAFMPDPTVWLESLRRVSEHLHIDRDPRPRLRNLLRAFTSRLGVERGSVILVEDGRARVEAAVGDTGGMVEGEERDLDPTSVAGRVYESGEARLIQGRLENSNSGNAGVRSAICVPVLCSGVVLGVANFSSMSRERVLTQQDLEAARVFGTLIALSVYNQRLLVRTVELERLGAVGSAMAAVSHSLKNLLTIFQGSVQLMERALERQDAGMTLQAFNTLKGGVRRIDNLVLDLLHFAKRREPVREAVKIEELVQTLGEDFERWQSPTRRRLEIVCDVQGEYLLDGAGLERALLNLVNNAADAIPNDGRIRITIAPEEGSLRFTIADDGPGVPEELLERVFAPFFSTKGSRGTGLGLPMVKKFAEENGGTIRADRDDELGGFRVSFTLPLLRAESKEVAIR